MDIDTNAVATVVWAIAIFTIPGALFNRLSGLNTIWSLAASVPVSFGMFGLAGWLLSVLGISFSPFSFSVMLTIFCALAALWNVFYGRRKQRVAPEVADEDEATEDKFGDNEEERVVSRRWRSPVTLARERGTIFQTFWLLPAFGIAVGAGTVIAKCLRYLQELPPELGGLTAIFQGWDVHWHANTVEFIIDKGIADPTRMGELRNLLSDDKLYYPNAWHTGAALLAEVSGMSSLTAVNITGIVLPAILLPTSTALLVWRMVDNRTLLTQIACALAAVAVVFAPTIFWIGFFVGAFPYLAAICATGIVAALFMSVPMDPKRAVPASAAFMGMVMLHPSSVTVVVLMLAIWWIAHLLIHPTYRVATDSAFMARVRDVAVLAIVGVVSIVLLLPQLLSGSSVTEEVSNWGGGEEGISRFDSWLKILAMGTRHTDFFQTVSWGWLFVLAIVGGLVLVNWRFNIWAPVYFLVSTAIAVFAIHPFTGIVGDLLGIVSGLHYNAAHRLVMPVSMMLFAAAGIGAAAIIRCACLFWVKSPAAQTTSRLTSIVLTLVIALITVPVLGAAVADGEKRVLDISYQPRMVTPADRKAFDWLAQQPRAYEGKILGDASDGYGWMYPYNKLPSLSNHYQLPENIAAFLAGKRDADDMAKVLYRTTEIGTGTPDNPDGANDVDKALNNIDVNYFYLSPPSFWPWQQEDFIDPVVLENLRGITLIYRDADVWIYAVNNKFSDQEITQMRLQSPGPLAPLPSYGSLGKEVAPDDVENGDANPWNYNYYFRPEGL